MSASTEIIKKPRKKSRVAVGDGDIVSNIHDNVLSHIFSRMPIDDAVRTSIMSKDWKYKWTSLYKLDIKSEHWIKNPKSLANFLDRALPSIQCLRIFSLKCFSSFRDKDEYFQRWVSAALEHNLEIFEVELIFKIVLPFSLLNSNSLTELRFRGGKSSLNVGVKNVAPKLTSLYLKYVSFLNGNPTLTFTFPVLETLTLVSCKWLDVRSVEIYAPTLTEFTSSTSNIEEEYDYSIVIVAPKITFLFIGGGIPEKISVSRSSVVSAYLVGRYGRRADLGLRRVIGLRVGNLLNGFTSLEELVLHSCLAQLLPLCRHDKLKRLTLIGHGNFKLLLKLLHAAPSLKFLSIEVDKWCVAQLEGLKCYPTCIASNLEEVVLKCFENMNPQYDLAEFFSHKRGAT